MPSVPSVQIGLLSTFSAPLLPMWLDACLRHGVTDICVILDSKDFTAKDMNIWHARVGNRFDQAPQLHEVTAGIPIYLVGSHNAPATAELVQSLGLECLANAGTPRKLGSAMLNAARFGVVNVHPGLLPKYRGASAVEWSILNGDPTGNTAHLMDTEYDAGPVIETEVCPIRPEDTYQDIRTRIYRKGCDMMGRVLASLQNDGFSKSNLIPQDEALAQLHPPIDPASHEKMLQKLCNNGGLR